MVQVLLDDDGLGKEQRRFPLLGFSFFNIILNLLVVILIYAIIFESRFYIYVMYFVTNILCARML